MHYMLHFFDMMPYSSRCITSTSMLVLLLRVAFTLDSYFSFSFKSTQQTLSDLRKILLNLQVIIDTLAILLATVA